MTPQPPSTGRPPRVGLYATCLVDMIRPSVGFAAATLLERAGCAVEVPAQTCCGQPAFNSGDRGTARALAEQVLAAFESYDYVVAPSGSCAGMIKTHYPELFAGEPDYMARMDRFCAKVYELTSFLVDVMGVRQVEAAYEGRAAYHDSCSGLRELSVHDQPRALLASVSGLSLAQMEEADTCCGFGGTFCVKYPEISDAIVRKKAENVIASGADTLLAGDLGCLMNMAGKLQRMGAHVKVRHVAEVLAGQGANPAIGEPKPKEAGKPEEAKS